MSLFLMLLTQPKKAPSSIFARNMGFLVLCLLCTTNLLSLNAKADDDAIPKNLEPITLTDESTSQADLNQPADDDSSQDDTVDKLVGAEPVRPFSLELSGMNNLQLGKASFNIRSSDGTPNILSELKWKDLLEEGLQGRAKLIYKDGWYLRGMANYNFTASGRLLDSDYFGNNRSERFSLGRASTTGHTSGTSLGLGYQFKLLPEHQLKLGPVAGFGYDTLGTNATNIQDTFLQIYTINMPGTVGKYTQRWLGPFIGVDMDWRLSKRFSIFSMSELHWLFYNEYDNYLLRPDLAHPVSHRLSADGFGLRNELGAQYRLSRRLSLLTSISYTNRRAMAGLDHIYGADGSTSSTTMNKALWNDWALNVGLMFKI